MHALKERLAALAEALGLNATLLTRAQSRYKARRRDAYKSHRQALKQQTIADQLRQGGHIAQADSTALAAQKLHTRAYNQHVKAQVWLGRIKRLTQRINGLEQTQAELTADLKRLYKVEIRGDHATGSSAHARLRAVALASAAACASGRRANFYSQTGAFDADHCITGPAYGHRDDCSSWFASVYKSAGLPDPSAQNFTAGYTETLMANGTQTNAPVPGDAVIYGSYPGHHVEMFVAPGKTIGHGSAPVDAGVPDLFGDGDYAFYTFPKK